MHGSTWESVVNAATLDLSLEVTERDHDGAWLGNSAHECAALAYGAESNPVKKVCDITIFSRFKVASDTVLGRAGCRQQRVKVTLCSACQASWSAGAPRQSSSSRRSCHGARAGRGQTVPARPDSSKESEKGPSGQKDQTHVEFSVYSAWASLRY